MQLALLDSVSTPATDLAVVYLPGLDIVQHALLGEQTTAVAASTLAARLAAVKQYYAILGCMGDLNVFRNPLNMNAFRATYYQQTDDAVDLPEREAPEPGFDSRDEV